ncbi:KpsF/GutQ family sugar-phosphate isomerase [Dongia deserti]|uniref:KpsF/GutQ family sugar-phosphate isomerase n=1 Tax=Dongia deserti TaxID=2268030 RepID=UPI000E64B102|nr:KpsF/GutQ family sugar-phosphate isomerase [Dongia deserti]
MASAARARTSSTAAETTAEGLAAAQRVLTQEADALVRLARELDERVLRALDILAGVTGRVIVTGMGKSGHIARKIAATFASTGTPAQFVHPAEASHGDLGMVTAADAVVALSNSGETFELADIVSHTRRWSIPLIAITGNANSSLSNAADVALSLPKVGEAGTMAIAPTTSTTMMLALGDALAVALLERKGFSTEDFRALHPGGKLGQKLLRVSDLMHVGKELPLISVESGMQEAILEMTTKTYGCVGAIDGDGDLVGIITDGDLRRHMNVDLMHRTVREVMTEHPRTIRAEALAAEAVHLMNEKSITSLFVLEDSKPVGIVRLHDCLRAGVA